MKVRMSGPDLACYVINLVSAVEYSPHRIVKCAIFVVDLVDSRTPTHGVVFTEDVAKTADQQCRYAVGHDVLLGATMASAIGLLIVTSVFNEGKERNRALRVFSAATGSGFAAGMILGGVITANSF